MPLNPRDFQQVYNILRDRVLRRYPDADFSQGSFNDLYIGALALMYQEFQAYSLDLFRKTWITNPQNTGQDLESLAVDHYHLGAGRPSASKAVGTVTITRQDGNTDKITVSKGDEFTVGENTYVAIEEVIILAAAQSGSVILEAEEGGIAGNLAPSQMWSSDLSDVDIANPEAFLGGTDVPDDEAYRTYIQNFVESIQDGTRQGLEGTAKLVSGVTSANLVRKLVDVGTLASNGALATGGNLFRFKAVRLLLYIGGLTGTVNSAVKSLVEKRIAEQLSAGERIQVISSTPVEIDWTVDLTFASSSQALALAQQRETLKDAFAAAINNLAVGTDFVRATVGNSVLSANNWTGLFTISTSKPSGDVTIAENEKAFAGDIVITVS